MSEKRNTLPQGWEWKKLGDLSVLITKGSTPTTYGYKYVDKGINFIKIENISDGKIQLHTIQNFITEEAHLSQKRSILQENDILFSIAGTIGESCIVSKNDLPANTNQALAIIRLKHDIDPHYARLLLSSEVLDEIRNKQRGGALKNISLEDVKNALIPLPPLEEQRRIVGKLDGLFAKIDKSIALLDESIASASALMPSALNEVFEELGEKWEIKSLSKVVKINSGITLPSIFKDKEHFNGGEIPFYKVAQMNNHHSLMTIAELYFSEVIAKKEKIKIFPKGSILIPKRGGAILTNKKRMMIADASYDSNIMGLKAINEVISDEFLFSFLQSIDLSNFVDTTTIPQINNKHIDMMKIPLPPLDIQNQTVTYLDALQVKADALKKVQVRKKEELLALKASLLESAFKGEL